MRMTGHVGRWKVVEVEVKKMKVEEGGRNKSEKKKQRKRGNVASKREW